MKRAVVFAYHDVGVRCLQVLISHGVEIALVVTHDDDPKEEIWFDSVSALCRRYDLPCIAPADPNHPDVVERVEALAPDFLFSFYYRRLLRKRLLAIPRDGAFNVHGSLLPRYRGRAPVNWAILHGESETGATLHAMELEPDAGAVVDRVSVPILIDDTSIDVYRKVIVAAEICLQRALPSLLCGEYPLEPQDPALASYFGARSADDGRIPVRASALQIHNLVRAVSRPFPGAFIDTPAGRLMLWKTRIVEAPPSARGPGIHRVGPDRHYWIAPDGGCLLLLDFEIDGRANTLPDAAGHFDPFGSSA